MARVPGVHPFVMSLTQGVRLGANDVLSVVDYDGVGDHMDLVRGADEVD